MSRLQQFHTAFLFRLIYFKKRVNLINIDKLFFSFIYFDFHFFFFVRSFVRFKLMGKQIHISVPSSSRSNIHTLPSYFFLSHGMSINRKERRKQTINQDLLKKKTSSSSFDKKNQMRQISASHFIKIIFFA